MFIPATAKGYSQVARFPSSLNNNLRKDTFILDFIKLVLTHFLCTSEIRKVKHKGLEGEPEKENTIICRTHTTGQKAYRISPGEKQQVL